MPGGECPRLLVAQLSFGTRSEFGSAHIAPIAELNFHTRRSLAPNRISILLCRLTCLIGSPPLVRPISQARSFFNRSLDAVQCA